MKQHTHLAGSLLIVCCGAASAQSSVTAFGLVDAMAGRFKGAVTGVNGKDVTTARLDSGGLSTSYIGFRGIEDLGDGATASFELSGFLRTDTGQTGRSDAIGPPVNIAADPFWSRASWVGLSSKTLGRVRLGNASTLLYLNSLSSNAFGDSMVFSPINLVTFIGGPLSGGTSWTNQVIYDSPVLAGFSAAAQVAASEGQGGRNAGARLKYANAPFDASIAYSNVKKNPLTFADGTSQNNTKSWQLAASYDFNVAKLFAHLGGIQNNGTEAAPLNVTYKLWELSAAIPVGIGNVLAGYASRTTGDSVGPVPPTVAGGNKQRNVATLGYDHLLSKRTDLYAMVLHDRTRTNSLPAPPQLVEASATNFGIGIRHRF